MGWTTAIIEFFLDTRLGRTLLFAAAMTTAVAITYFWIDGKAYDRGYNKAMQEWQQAQLDAGTKLLNDRSTQAKAGSEISAKADAAASKVSAAIDAQTQRDKDKNHEDYARQKPVPSACTPVAVPASVQARIDAAVRGD